MQYSQALIKALGDVIYERCLISGQISWHGDFVRILGYSPQEMGDDNALWLDRLFSEDKTRVLTKIAAACEQHQPYDIEYRFRHHDGSYVWIQDRGVPHQSTAIDGEPTVKVVGVMRDISDRKRAELEMKNALLRERELNQLKTRFIDIASHEFRTPLTSILGFTELLEQYSHKFNPEVHRKHLKRIRSAAERLQELVDNVLSVSRADAGNVSLELSPVDIEYLCRDIFHELNGAFGGIASLRLALDSKLQGDRPLHPVIDARIIRHILTNLLSNALKYTLSKKAVQLKVQYDKQQIIFIVQDQGIGIPEADLPHLFEPFHRATNVGKIPGTGLGLHIVERYVELHNGAIMVTSAMNTGTTFRVNIPCIFVEDA
ncbi:PAS domain-containing sensor histidine kinase [[Limnothrix rosea] IAM M-220]|uniref:PAS domain-containing sensor histidine kinase n=1 Tax=[Limnothrix rosea] IAM M-220 TaxID=454133 RepID=UPI000959498B|nr:PAS domain-containing sensor histidine kinase [[Limnothrix rosea] IAM M-220]OKH16894.1 PAS domain-containing sensor histidine kinase [[Limnothrix rosea] IAM M-220]